MLQLPTSGWQNDQISSGHYKLRKDVFSSCHERGTKKKFWVPMRNRNSDLRIWNVTRRKNISLNSSPSSKLTMSTFLLTTNLPSGQGSSLFKLLLKKNPASQADEFWGFIQNGFPPLLCVGLDVIILGVGVAAKALHGFANGQQTSTYFAGQQDAGKSSKTSAHKD